MPKSRDQKQAELDALTDELRNSQVVILSDYRGLPVADVNKLRGQLRDKGANFIVAKNTLMSIALRQTNSAAPEDLLSGPTALTFVRDDIPGTIKVLNQFVRDSKIMTVKGAILGQSVFKGDQVDQLVTMPTLPESRARIVGAIVGPMSGLVTVINGPMQQLVTILDATRRDLVSIIQQRADQLGAPEASS
ncbi:MAG: 50S ribosomal protein L10 [Anaerolineae bacterium]